MIGKTPGRNRFGRSIVLFSALAVLLSWGFILGIFLDVQVLTELLQGQEMRCFSELSRTVASLIETSLVNIESADGISDADVTAINSQLMIARLNPELRVYLVTRKKVYVLFPERTSYLTEKRVTEVSESLWMEGWQGKQYLTSPYEKYSLRTVQAYVIPLPVSDETPDYIVAVERTLFANQRVNLLLKLLNGFMAVFAIVFTLILILYAQSMLKPFDRLVQAISKYFPSGMISGHRIDPVSAAIENYEGLISDLRMKESDLERLNENLARCTSRSDQMQDAILSNIGSGVLTFDGDQRLISASSHVKHLLGLSEDLRPGQVCAEIFGRGSFLQVLLIESILHGRTYVNRRWNPDIPKDKNRWLSVTTIRLQNDAKQTVAVTIILRDITESRRLEEQIRDQEHLAALGELSAGIAHEIRNPLGAIAGNTDYLISDLKDPDLLEVARDIKDQVQVLDRIINDFLKFARPAKPDVTSVELPRFLTCLLEDLTQDRKDEIQTEVDVLQPVPQVQIDEVLMRQVFQNLLINSVQSIESTGRITITLQPDRLKRSASVSNPAVRIVIRDTGSGIQPEDIPNLFKPFFTTKSSGTGLGLAIAKRFILLHNGIIEFDTSVETGSAVVILVPIEYDPERTIEMESYVSEN